MQIQLCVVKCPTLRRAQDVITRDIVDVYQPTRSVKLVRVPKLYDWVTLKSKLVSIQNTMYPVRSGHIMLKYDRK